MKSIDARRITRTAAIDAMISTSAGLAAYRQDLAAECAESSLIALMETALRLPGDLIEFGVFRGNAMRRMAHVLAREGSGKRLYACDSFEGFPEGGIGKADTSWFRPIRHLQGKFREAADVPAHLGRIFSGFGVDGVIVRGFFDQTLPALADARFCFAHVDCDTYQSHVDCLGFAWERLAAGGIMVFDDYAQPKWPGATRAIDEFFTDRPEKPQLAALRPKPAWHAIKAG